MRNLIIKFTHIGLNAGLFDIYTDVNLITPIYGGVTRQQLLNGYNIIIPSGSTYVYVESDALSICNDSFTINLPSDLPPTPTPTPTITVTPTVTPTITVSPTLTLTPAVTTTPTVTTTVTTTPTLTPTPTPTIGSIDPSPTPTVTPTLTPTITPTNPAQTIACLDGLIVETIYIGNFTDMGALPSNYTHPCPSTISDHTCNRAYFEIYANNTYVGDSLLNNANGSTLSGTLTQSGKYVCGDYDNYPIELNSGYTWTQSGIPKSGESRYSKTVISNQQATSMAAGGNSILFKLIGTQKIYGTGGNTESPNNENNVECGVHVNRKIPHSNVTWLRISRTNGDLVYNGCPSQNVTTGNFEAIINVCNILPTPTPTPTVTPTITVTPTRTPPILYYTLNGCDQGDPNYTTTVPPLITSQRYVDPQSGRFWVWNNEDPSESPQTTLNASLQRTDGLYGCP